METLVIQSQTTRIGLQDDNLQSIFRYFGVAAIDHDRAVTVVSFSWFQGENSHAPLLQRRPDQVSISVISGQNTQFGSKVRERIGALQLAGKWKNTNLAGR